SPTWNLQVPTSPKATLIYKILLVFLETSKESFPAPELPDWCLEEEEGFSDNDEQNGETMEDGSRPSTEVETEPRGIPY
ncbi:hypothetical protein OS493_040516, partial [Desmophyllum pertusum]